jgi:hypothetical protein
VENPEGQLLTHKGKCKHGVTKDSTGRSSCTANIVDKHDKTYKCSALDCKEIKALHPSPFSEDMRQSSTECITQARSYTALLQLASAITGKASRETNNSRITFNANIPMTAINQGAA